MRKEIGDIIEQLTAAIGSVVLIAPATVVNTDPPRFRPNSNFFFEVIVRTCHVSFALLSWGLDVGNH
jgi:hypothetical protein